MVLYSSQSVGSKGESSVGSLLAVFTMRFLVLGQTIARFQFRMTNISIVKYNTPTESSDATEKEIFCEQYNPEEAVDLDERSECQDRF